MDLYILRMIKIGFSINRAYEVYADYRDSGELERLDRYLAALEDSWSVEQCG